MVQDRYKRFHLVQGIKMECLKDPMRTVGLDDFIAICKTIANNRVQAKLPPDASWRVCHPDSCAIRLWDNLIRLVALFFFWCDGQESCDIDGGWQGRPSLDCG